jgi:hypothetical protein
MQSESSSENQKEQVINYMTKKHAFLEYTIYSEIRELGWFIPGNL